MKIALAQIQSIAGDVEINTRKHEQAIRQASNMGAHLVVFPELSITGYEPSLAQDLAFDHDDSRLTVFQTLSDELNISVAVGCPLRSEDKPQIGLVLFQAYQERTCYAKQHLHVDELPYFTQGNLPMVLSANGNTIAFAICYESLVLEHNEQAMDLGADLYIASVAKPKSGVKKAYEHFESLSRKTRLTVLMVNSVGPSDNFISVGRSAVWDNRENQPFSLLQDEEALLIWDQAIGEADRRNIPM